jgi:hypothetical protein
LPSPGFEFTNAQLVRTTATVEAHDSNACTELPIRHHAVYPRRAPANASPTALRANASSPRPHPFASRGWLVGSGWLRGAGAYLSPPLALHPARVSRAVLPGACTCNAAQHREVDGTELHFAEPRAGGTERDAHRGRPYRAERFENLRCGSAGGLVVGAGSRPVCLHARAWGCMEQVHTPSNPVKHHALNVVRPTLGVSSL